MIGTSKPGNAVSLGRRTLTVASRVLRSPVPILLFSVGLNVMLAARVNVLQSTIGALKAEGRLKLGTTVSALVTKRLDKSPFVVRYGDVQVPTVLYVMRPGCIWCQRNHNNLRAVVSGGAKYRFIQVSVVDEGSDEYSATHPLDATMVIGLSDEAKREYKLGGTPQTLVISPEGVVLQNWTGAYTGQNATEIEDFFGVKLPGLIEIPIKPSKREGSE